MFTVNREQPSQEQPYLTYVLTDDSSAARLEVVPERGGIITQWQVQGQAVLYLDRDRFANPELSVRGGVPILFPICGNLPDNTYTHNGQTYTLKQHGFARDLPWEVTGHSTQNAASLTLSLSSSDRTRDVYPFDFQLEFTYLLAGQTLTIQQRFTNRSSEPMPFSTGLHPYFQVTDKTALQFEIPGKEYFNHLDRQTSSFSGFDFEQPEIDVAFKPISAQTTSVTDTDRSLHLQLDYDTCYSTLVFWTVKGKDYYCLEPWSAPRNAMNSGDALLVLQPGETLSAIVKMTVNFS